MRLVTMKFSASQTTAKVVDQLCAGLGLPRRDLNLNEGASLGPQDCLIAAFPVFSGRLKRQQDHAKDNPGKPQPLQQGKALYLSEKEKP